MRNFLRRLATLNKRDLYVTMNMIMSDNYNLLIKRYPESSKDEKALVNFNGVNYMRHISATREVNNSIYLNRYETRKYVYEKMSIIWVEM